MGFCDCELHEVCINYLKEKAYLSTWKTHVPITKINCLMLFREIIAIMIRIISVLNPISFTIYVIYTV
jgi:hypothetical protein